MRDLHAAMLAALLEGEGLKGIAELAAAEAGSPVAIVLPARGLVASSEDDAELDALKQLASELIGGDEAREGAVRAAFPVEAGGRTIGYTIALPTAANGLPDVKVDVEEVLRTAALATLTVLAVADARDEVAGELRGTLLEDLRSGSIAGEEVLRRAARLGSDLSGGTVVLVVELRTAKPRHVAAVITGEHPGALAEALAPADGGGGPERVYALLPSAEGDDAAARTLASARSIVSRLRQQGTATFSSFCDAPADLGRAVAEAELMLDVVSRDERLAEQLSAGISDGVYRLLFRALASDPEEVRRFYEETVAPLVEHDREYRTDLLGTLEAYLTNDCNMNATARAVYAHRHTVAHRLTRIRELCGLNPSLGEDRERLGLGIKAFRILEPALPR